MCSVKGITFFVAHGLLVSILSVLSGFLVFLLQNTCASLFDLQTKFFLDHRCFKGFSLLLIFILYSFLVVIKLNLSSLVCAMSICLFSTLLLCGACPVMSLMLCQLQSGVF